MAIPDVQKCSLLFIPQPPGGTRWVRRARPGRIGGECFQAGVGATRTASTNRAEASRQLQLVELTHETGWVCHGAAISTSNLADRSIALFSCCSAVTLPSAIVLSRGLAYERRLGRFLPEYRGSRIKRAKTPIVGPHGLRGTHATLCRFAHVEIRSQVDVVDEPASVSRRVPALPHRFRRPRLSPTASAEPVFTGQREGRGPYACDRRAARTPSRSPRA